jgi:hypothetical protein
MRQRPVAHSSRSRYRDRLRLLCEMARYDEPIRPMTLGGMGRHGVRGLFPSRTPPDFAFTKIKPRGPLAGGATLARLCEIAAGAGNACPALPKTGDVPPRLERC